jgi:uncharacterized membrane protein (UPF0127 family)
MRLVHESADGSQRVLATDVETADSLVAKTKGLMGRSSVPDDYALVFRFEPGPLERLHERVPAPLSRLTAGANRRSIHMLFVRTPLDVLWIRDGEVVQTRTLAPWRGTGSAPGDTVVEMAGGAADGVAVGDRVRVVEDDSGVSGRER